MESSKYSEVRCNKCDVTYSACKGCRASGRCEQTDILPALTFAIGEILSFDEGGESSSVDERQISTKQKHILSKTIYNEHPSK